MTPDELLMSVRDFDTVCVFGVSFWGCLIVQDINRIGKRCFFVDNCLEKQRESLFDGVDCISPYDASKDAFFIIALRDEKNVQEATTQLINRGISSIEVLTIEKMVEYERNADDKDYLKALFYIHMGYELNLDNPLTFNEKIQWLKLYNRKTEYTMMVDKLLVKDYVAGIIGQEFIIPTIGVWDNAEDILFEELPNSFVLKCTHDSGGLIICKDKSKLDIDGTRRELNRLLQRNYYYIWREWPYKDVTPRIIAEPYLQDSHYKELRDYKFFAFDGVPRVLFVAADRGKDTETTFDFFDMSFNHLEIINGHPNSSDRIEKPETFERMIDFVSKLSEDIPHVRVDFYEVDGRTYFGELTFFHWSGLVPFEPPQWDRTLGDWINLPGLCKM